MSDDTKKAVQEVMEAVTQLRENNDKLLAAKADGKAVGDLTAKVEKISDKLDQYENTNQQIVLAQKTQQAQQEQLDRLETLLNRAAVGGGGAKGEDDAQKLRAAFDRVMRTRHENRAPEDVSLLKQHMAALVKGDDASAGYLLAPPDLERAILKDIIEMSPIRALATVRTIGAHSYKWPKRIGTGSATRVGEVQPRPNSTDPRYGMGEILAPEMFARHEVSQQMLEDSGYDLMAELREEVSEQMAVKEGIESVSGTGNANHQMEGFLVASGIGEVVSGHASQITADGLLNLFYELKTVYTRSAVWAMNRRTIRDIRKLKDNQGQYLWVAGIANAAPNTINGTAYVEFPDMPDVGAGAYPVAFGDFKRAYTIVDRVGLGFMPDYITGADDGLVVYRARKRVGGGVKKSEALKKLKIGTA
ncbi:phage major capsid protein [Azohydromonas aeria]|uniref:phage major capsid protein n=1 Tax=Azohydromonas aeria TaxID=2590212 RepID=UPI0012FA8373|nr:phage major capsid protein [Azohydromonas aeria]